MSQAGSWGITTEWPCGHRAVVLGEHALTHPHWCPECDGRRDPGCDIEYLDVHCVTPLLGSS
jgi:hypothetical protein